MVAFECIIFPGNKEKHLAFQRSKKTCKLTFTALKLFTFLILISLHSLYGSYFYADCHSGRGILFLSCPQKPSIL